mmetsp:Transcript_4498/g.11489  ORF Transcript_4498/g.11489 Transcript_4498/m.11489 type:complete len:299 (-) Transcript_4498:267-1163(-)|eukprot:CAMPEP_0182916906 /NCGR_PEP_ID=MMETSP0105_2-20130417/1207_1 /TAXON_ID=81532 ORGANISM="Acanthoeca-like sp., Strain 10tr" /NCGR_SAMPLE_ID=MMETSP0105_2 /ASSEMBLY_ACC=CAM_ASM_000205 /LENGTH=298 /DNA_ID=CAMNT_0025053875 /DNA_START=103 /DNA_END=999 /DNA_ORIENTATION=+
MSRRRTPASPNNPYAVPAAAGAPPPRRQSRFANTADADVAARQGGSNGQSDDSSFLSALNSLIESFHRWWRSLSSSRQSRALQEEPTDSATRGIDALRVLQGTHYTDPAHEHLLREVWALLGRGKPYERTSAKWGDVGFQGKDPATDFRGQGLLGLQNILFLARAHKEDCLRMLEQHSAGFPFALAVINISSFLMDVLGKYPGAVGNWLFVPPAPGVVCDPVAVFNHLFAGVFLEFEHFYAAQIREYMGAGGNPAFVIMQFNPIREKFASRLEQAVGTGTFQTTSVAAAVRAAAPEGS